MGGLEISSLTVLVGVGPSESGIWSSGLLRMASVDCFLLGEPVGGFPSHVLVGELGGAGGALLPSSWISWEVLPGSACKESKGPKAGLSLRVGPVLRKRGLRLRYSFSCVLFPASSFLRRLACHHLAL